MPIHRLPRTWGLAHHRKREPERTAGSDKVSSDHGINFITGATDIALSMHVCVVRQVGDEYRVHDLDVEHTVDHDTDVIFGDGTLTCVIWEVRAWQRGVR